MSLLVVFEPAFTAVCDECGTTTEWTKANRIGKPDGEPMAVKGYQCSQCGIFESKVLDTDGQIRSRE